jgi:hypothetical protein
MLNHKKDRVEREKSGDDGLSFTVQEDHRPRYDMEEGRLGVISRSLTLAKQPDTR